jgi:plastocyanin
MTGNGSTKAAYEPSSLTIAPGTTVRFINVSGGPHNITFWQDSVPAGAPAALNANMKNTVDNLSGPFLTQPNETYDVSFANAPKGWYKGYYPHVTLGMKIAIRSVASAVREAVPGGIQDRFLFTSLDDDDRHARKSGRPAPVGATPVHDAIPICRALRRRSSAHAQCRPQLDHRRSHYSKATGCCWDRMPRLPWPRAIA